MPGEAGLLGGRRESSGTEASGCLSGPQGLHSRRASPGCPRPFLTPKQQAERSLTDWVGPLSRPQLRVGQVPPWAPEFRPYPSGPDLEPSQRSLCGQALYPHPMTPLVRNSEACLRPELAQEGVSVSQGSGFKQLGQQEIDACCQG